MNKYTYIDVYYKVIAIIWRERKFHRTYMYIARN